MNPIVTFILAIADVAGTRFGHQVNDIVEILKFGAGMLDAADDIPPEFQELADEIKAMADQGTSLSPVRLAEFREARKRLSGGISDKRDELEQAFADIGALEDRVDLQAIVDDTALDGRIRNRAQERLDELGPEE